MIIVNNAAKAFVISKKADEKGKPPMKWVLVPGVNEVTGDKYKALKAHPYFKGLMEKGKVVVGKSTPVADADDIAAEVGLDE